MKKIKLKQFIKKGIPRSILSYFFKKKRVNEINIEFANFILASAVEYSKEIKGDASSFDRRLRNLIMHCENDCNSIIQDILTAFMPKYENNLYQYYKKQEYLIFYRFLTYPFSKVLSNYFLPYEKALTRLRSIDVLDYGAGIPYGIIYALLNKKESINSITIIDLDLIHVDFVQFLIEKIAPNIKLQIYRLNDADSFPILEGKYNFFFGKDIFEHLTNPLTNLRELMNYSEPEAICYFDFSDHGEKIYQHINPNITFLSDEMIKLGFRNCGQFFGLSEFIRI